jgi:hypothetical protein
MTHGPAGQFHELADPARVRGGLDVGIFVVSLEICDAGVDDDEGEVADRYDLFADACYELG